ncbi:DUF6292 family protein [Streptomyces sp. CB02115]|uniref:DUF6292 family protein n=1 Tax=Streptomyces sp. CB02115 TaxID=1703939 RepID=UPI00093E25EE|nr:DUF6292 family protein [Streptomyces sp. CB02115]OKJ48274.1 hypothetical protein AMK28_35870 [Streptomyces sp. CB02115]
MEYHRVYIEIVVRALEEADIDVSMWCSKGIRPRSARLTLSRRRTAPVHGDAFVVLPWTEEQGWTLGHTEDPARPPTETQQLFGIVLPEPRDLVPVVSRASFTRPVVGPVITLRRAGDNDGFEEQLASHWGPMPQPQPESRPEEDAADPRLNQLDLLLERLLTAYTGLAGGAPLPTPEAAQRDTDEIRAALADVHTYCRELRGARYAAGVQGYRSGARSARRRR